MTFSRQMLHEGTMSQEESIVKESVCDMCPGRGMTVCNTSTNRICCTEEIYSEKEDSCYDDRVNNVKESDGALKVIPVCFFCDSES